MKFLAPSFVVVTLMLGALAALTTYRGNSVRLVDSGIRIEELGTRFIISTLENVTDRSYTGLSVQIHMLDSDGEILASFAEEMTELRPGAKWDIEVPVLAENAVSYRVDSLQCAVAGDRMRWLPGRRCSVRHEGMIE